MWRLPRRRSRKGRHRQVAPTAARRRWSASPRCRPRASCRPAMGCRYQLQGTLAGAAHRCAARQSRSHRIFLVRLPALLRARSRTSRAGARTSRLHRFRARTGDVGRSAPRTCAAVLHAAGARQASMSCTARCSSRSTSSAIRCMRRTMTRRHCRNNCNFAKANGISETDFMRAYNSFGVQANLQKADDLMRRDRIEARTDHRDRRQVRERRRHGRRREQSDPADQRSGGERKAPLRARGAAIRMPGSPWQPACGNLARCAAPVAQLDRVAASEAAGRGFESRRARHFQ